ncbi:hypothetical protein COV11_01285 [Candidatus Woesearchaeota archaeon CG10_big_fil_rev_8_21_14_0_10_30_7]|nr:MAG: hypothetical protein COV11_01285 [Candidatus Woesearchaeota archaeon CG10_big_fil_rev_8_21_14_0_10_30_7]
MSDPYDKFKIKEYNLWDLYLHINQYPYIGRCYAAAKREEADVILDMNLHETSEIFEIIIPEWNNAVKRCYSHDRPNIAISGNDWKHLHCHLIPRYNTSRLVYGIVFNDPNPKGNYAPYSKKELEEKILMKIKEKIKENL